MFLSDYNNFHIELGFTLNLK